MVGPDFEISRVSDWQLSARGTAQLQLADGSTWTIDTTDPGFTSARDAIELARRFNMPIYVSGNRPANRLEAVLLPERLSPLHIAAAPVGGKVAATFHGPPSVYFLRTDRLWFTKSRNLLERTIAQETPTTFAPELLVTIDVSTMEIMDVRQPE